MVLAIRIYVGSLIAFAIAQEAGWMTYPAPLIAGAALWVHCYLTSRRERLEPTRGETQAHGHPVQ